MAWSSLLIDILAPHLGHGRWRFLEDRLALWPHEVQKHGTITPLAIIHPVLVLHPRETDNPSHSGGTTANLIADAQADRSLVGVARTYRSAHRQHQE